MQMKIQPTNMASYPIHRNAKEKEHNHSSKPIAIDAIYNVHVPHNMPDIYGNAAGRRLLKAKHLDIESLIKQFNSLSIYNNHHSKENPVVPIFVTDCMPTDESPKKSIKNKIYIFEIQPYQLDILQHLRTSEQKHCPQFEYMQHQKEISPSMRSILVDWLVQVTEQYNLNAETLYLTVSYTDRLLSQVMVIRPKLQLVAIAAMFIAIKFEEILAPDLGVLVFLTDNSYTKEHVLHMERLILKTLSFEVCIPTVNAFINAYAVISQMSKTLKYLTLFIAELALMEGERYLKYKPSLVAAASLALSRCMLGKRIWSSLLENITSYKLEDLRKPTKELWQTHKDSAKLTTQAIRKKYGGEKYRKVAAIETIPLKDDLFDQIRVVT